ncbi:glycine zipper 2TM domain-containing protein [Massilia sp. YIM B02769]|uniref:glycine zipper 2TM domain-containing protein n=1 Tax=unclassified Massilia TaxID=2609279 RepID=UPI0025B6D865|nr:MULTISPECIES: glycine zipper 2TM domain-containing protein [unclassified Massilia]MDN4060479.1 glycine zipper 2TM domain-containing protein [Massilia sp. YIM B02769]
MNNIPNPPARAQHHPLLLIAALAVVLFCLVGTAAIMGWIPSSIGGNAGRQLNEADRAALAASLPPPNQAAPALPDPAADPLAGQAAGAAALAPAAAAAPAYPAQQVAQGYAPAPAPAPAEPAPVTHPKAANKPVQVAAADTPKWCGNCGNVESVRAIKQRAQGSGLGAAGGAVVGGLLGNQIGGGHGRQLATVAGAIGGAVVGNQVEGNMKATTSYEIRVRLDDGTLRTFHQNSQPQWRNGDRVRIVKGRLRAA